MPDLNSLLLKAADTIGDVRPPSVTQLVARRRRQRGWQTGGAVLATIIAMLAIAAIVARPTNRAPDRALTKPPAVKHTTAPAVSLDQLRNFRWQSLPEPPITPRDGAVVVWTGRQVIVWGGSRGNGPLADGAAYDPATRRWAKMPASPLAPTADAQGVWTGDAMVIWTAKQGASYEPSAGRWTLLPRFGEWAKDQLRALVAVGGRAVALHAADQGTTVHADAYEARRDRWQALPDIHLAGSKQVTEVDVVEVGGFAFALVQWAVTHRTDDGFSLDFGVDGYKNENGAWRASASVHPDRGHSAAEALALGNAVFFPQLAAACICPQPARGQFRGVLVDPVTGSRRPSPELGPVGGGEYVSTGRAVIVLNTTRLVTGWRGTKPGDLAAWQPGRASWVRMPSATLGRGGDPAVVWAGDRLFVWGEKGGFEFAG